MAEKRVSSCASKAAGIVGIFILLCGFGNVVCGLLYFVKENTEHHSMFMRCGHGIWSGIMFVVTGSLGIAVWVKRKTLLAILFAAVDVALVIIAAGQCIMIVIILYSPSIANIPRSECNTNNGSCGTCQQSFITGQWLCDWSVCTEYLFLAILVISSVALFLCWMGSIIGCIGGCLLPAKEKPKELVITAPGTVAAATEFDFLAPTSPFAVSTLQPVYINPLCDRPGHQSNSFSRDTRHGKTNSTIDPFDDRL